MEEKLDLLDRLHRVVGCEYFSDMKSSAYRDKVLQAIRTVPVPDYTFQEWSTALAYLFEEETLVASLSELHEALSHQMALLSKQEAVK